MACLTIFFLVSGTSLVILSAFIAGILISKKESIISDIEDETSQLKKKLSGAHAAIQRSYQHFAPSDIKLLVIQASAKQADFSPVIREIFKGYVHGNLERYTAAFGEGPSDKKFKEWEAIAIKAANGDTNSFEELSKISNSLISEWVSRHESIISEMRKKEQKVIALKSKVSNYRSLSVTLQILGLILVLLKDVATV